MFSTYGCILHDLPWNSIIKKVTARCTPPRSLQSPPLRKMLVFVHFLPRFLANTNTFRKFAHRYVTEINARYPPGDTESPLAFFSA